MTPFFVVFCRSRNSNTSSLPDPTVALNRMSLSLFRQTTRVRLALILFSMMASVSGPIFIIIAGGYNIVLSGTDIMEI
jgi:hypothetical protein